MAAKTIGRQDIVADVAKETGLSQAKVNEALTAILGVIHTNMRKGNRVTIVGHGSYFTRKRAARKGRNPATGEAIKIKASTVPAFKAGVALKEAVNK